MANELKKLRARSQERPENDEIYKALRQILEDIQLQVDPQISMESFSWLATRRGVAEILFQLSDLLSGPVADLLQGITSDSKVSDMEKTVKDYASMRGIVAIYKQCAMLMQTLEAEAASNYLSINSPIEIKNEDDEVVTSFTIKQALDTLRDKLGSTAEGGLPSVISSQLNRMMVNWAKEFYGEDYVDTAASVLWIKETTGQTRKNAKGRIKTIRVSGEHIDIAHFAATLDKDIGWCDKLFFSASDSGDFFTSLVFQRARKAHLLAERKAGDYWYRLEDLRSHMKELFGTEDCRILFEELDILDKYGNPTGKKKLSGNLICVGLEDDEHQRNGLLYGKWEEERRAFDQQLKSEFRDELVRMEREFYANPENENSIFHITDFEAAEMYSMFIKGRWEEWHAEHSVRDESAAHKNAWIPNPDLYHNP